MKIALFSDNFFPEIGGIQDSIATFGKELGKRGHEVHYYVPSASDHDYQVIKIPRQEIDLGSHVHVHRLASIHFPSSTHQSRLVIPTFFRWQNIARVMPDIVHSQSPFGVGIEAISVARRLHIPLVGTNHTAIDAFAVYSPIKQTWFKELAMRGFIWYYNHCDYLTAPSESVFKAMIPYGLRPPHEVISNPIDLSEFQPKLKADRKALKRKFGISEHSVVYAGRLAVEKNIDVIIRAIAVVKKKIPSITFALAGHGRDHAPELERLAEELGVRKNVIFLGTLSKPDLADLYRASEVFAITSTSETQSMVTLQAMGVGLPAVGVNSRALPEYINAKNGFIVPPGDATAFADRLQFLLEHPVKRHALGKAAMASVQKFSIDAVVTRWETIYKRLAKKKRP
jgi:1,2-diacylglycerol 3-alpha-glucosyltransferase